MYIIGHRLIYGVDLGEFMNNSFFTGVEKSIFMQQPMNSSYKKCANVQAVLSIKLKFDMFIVDHRSSYCINFGVSRRHSLFYRKHERSYITSH